MSLEEEECLEVRCLKVDLVKFDRHAIVYTAQQALFMPPDRNGFEFCRRRNDLEKTFELCAFLERERVHLDSHVLCRGQYSKRILEKLDVHEIL